MTTVPLPCISCGYPPKAITAGDRQPLGATTFVSHGHYGSGVFDRMSGQWLEVNVCDDCIRIGARKGRVEVGSPPAASAAPPPTYAPFDPDAEDADA